MATSAGTLNRVSLIGFETAEPQKHTSEKGSAVSVSLATNREWTKKDGEKERKTDFHRVVFFGKFGEALFKSLAKGKKLYVEGEIHNNAYTGKNGEKKFSSEIVADSILFLDKKDKNGAEPDDEEGEEE